MGNNSQTNEILLMFGNELKHKAPYFYGLDNNSQTKQRILNVWQRIATRHNIFLRLGKDNERTTHKTFRKHKLRLSKTKNVLTQFENIKQRI